MIIDTIDEYFGHSDKIKFLYLMHMSLEYYNILSQKNWLRMY